VPGVNIEHILNTILLSLTLFLVRSNTTSCKETASTASYVTIALELMIMMLFSRLENFDKNLRFMSIDIKMMDKFKMAARHEFAIVQLVFMQIN
jgi:hypothetical protein